MLFTYVNRELSRQQSLDKELLKQYFISVSRMK